MSVGPGTGKLNRRTAALKLTVFGLQRSDSVVEICDLKLHFETKLKFPMFTEGINQVRRRRIFSLTSSPCQCVLGPEMFPQRQSARLSETLHKIQCICSICFLSRVAYIPCVYVDGKNVLTFVPLVELRMCIKWGRVVNHPISGSYMLCFNINTCSSFFLQQKVSTLLLQFPQNPFL